MASYWTKKRVVIAGVLLIWSLYSSIYIYLKQSASTANIAAYLSLFGELSLDIVVAAYMLRLSRHAESTDAAGIFAVFALAFASAGIADGVYNLILNIYNFSYINPFIASLFDVPFAIFLFLQLVGWLKIFLADKKVISGKNNISLLPYIIISSMLFLMFMFVINWQIEYSSMIGLFQAVDTMLEVLGFALVTSCLARERSDFVCYSALGYLLIVSSDFIIRYHVVSGMIPYLSSLEMVWILGLALFCVGSVFTFRGGKIDEGLVLQPINSLQAQITAWLLVLWMASIFMFAGIYFFSSMDSESNFSFVAKNSLVMIVPFSVLAILSSGFISRRISSPLSRLELMVAGFLDANKLPPDTSCSDDRYYIHEFNAFEDFVTDACLVSHQKHLAEVGYAKSLAQMAHDIRSPLAVLNIISADVVGTSGDTSSMMKEALLRINNIADDLLRGNRSYKAVRGERISQEVMKDLINKIIAEKQLQFPQASIKLIVANNAIHAIAEVDVVKFMRMMSNLVNNAVESTDGHGVVEITTSVVSNEISICITDNGCGIPAELLSVIFKQGTTTKTNGFGLGLSHAKDVMNAAAGSIDVESTPGRGTKVLLLLPCHQGGAPSP